MVECAELIAADLFRNADQSRARLTFGDVERYSPSWPVIHPVARVAAAGSRRE